ncbi:MAG: helix-turn-helix domain-containing protein [Hyphomicrobium sp.]|uniref:helix-turn-helix domain-containing protein n=1 Tax=Hyphomicrobium sp. TaxID=82 RepID=UPI003567BA48
MGGVISQPTFGDKVRSFIAAAAREHGVTVADVLGRGRIPPISAARHDAIRATKAAFPHLSLSQIGKLFNRNHTTVNYALNGKPDRPPKSTDATVARVMVPRCVCSPRRLRSRGGVTLPNWLPADLAQDYVDAAALYGEFGAASHCRQLKREMEAGA